MGGIEDAAGWTVLADAGPEERAAFVAIVLTCALLALRGVIPGGAIASLLLRLRPPR